jgi:hypothetical protein
VATPAVAVPKSNVRYAGAPDAATANEIPSYAVGSAADAEQVTALDTTFTLFVLPSSVPDRTTTQLAVKAHSTSCVNGPASVKVPKVKAKSASTAGACAQHALYAAPLVPPVISAVAKKKMRYGLEAVTDVVAASPTKDPTPPLLAPQAKPGGKMRTVFELASPTPASWTLHVSDNVHVTACTKGPEIWKDPTRKL